MRSNKLEFPEPYKHEHPPVHDAIELFEEQLTFSQKVAKAWLSPDKQEKATQTVLGQAELLCKTWA